MSAKAEKDARELLLKEYRGMLSTHSRALPGYPFGSVVPYCLDGEGLPLILISRIAQHTRNLQVDPRCCLLIGEREAVDVQAAGRLSLVGDARQLQDETAIAEAAEVYYRCFPAARDYHRTHDFDFWRLEPVRWRFIGGFGAIHWLNSVTLANPFAGEMERGMLQHMNRDHAEAIAHYVALAGLPDNEPAELVGLDGEGLRLRIGAALHWLPYPQPCRTPAEVRAALVALARAEHWPAPELE